MKNNKLKEFMGKAKQFGDQNSEVILTVMTITGLVATAVSSYRAGKKAHDILIDHEENMRALKKNDKEGRREVMKDTIKKMAPVLAVPVVTGVATATCSIANCRNASKKIALLTTACDLAKNTAKEFQEKAEEVVGEKKIKQIKEKIISDDVKSSDIPENNEVEMVDGEEMLLCKDITFGGFFYSNYEKIRAAIRDGGAECERCNYISINEFRDMMDAPNIEIGNDLGYNANDLVGNPGYLPVTLTPVMTASGKTCIGIRYDIPPHADYNRFGR